MPARKYSPFNPEDLKAAITKEDRQLLANIHTRLPELTELCEDMNSSSFYENGIYRFCSGSIKVYALHEGARSIVEALRSIAPDGTSFCETFDLILKEGGVYEEWEFSHGGDWSSGYRPLVEAFCHAKYFLEMAVKYGTALNEAPNPFPFGWAALLCLYGVR